MTITCLDRDALEAYLLGDLDDPAIDAHLEACPGCQAALDRLDAEVNRPFQCLREPAAATADWEQSTFQQLVARATAIDAADTSVVIDPLQRTFGNYLLLEPISSISMGRVYKAEHRRLKKIVAIKFLAPQMLGSAEARRRFQREMEAVGQLASPHIVTAYDAGETDGLDYLAMEYVEGQNLSQLVREKGPLPIAEALDCIMQAARGLAHAHAAGIIHRDVKPSNLLRDLSGVVKVLDLGLARFVADEASHEVGIAGTVAFMAPEQASEPHSVDPRADIYSLGCTLYFLLTGTPPYYAASPLEVLAAHRDEPIPAVATARSDCPPAVDALVRQMMAKDPQDRPASMNDVIDQIERLLKPAPARRSMGWQGSIAALTGLAACLVTAFAFWFSGIANDAKKTPDKTPDGPQNTMPKKGATPEIAMATIPAGDFLMGASDTDTRAAASEKPSRKVKINRSFFLGKTEVTQAQYEEVMGNNPSAFSKNGANKARVNGLDTSQHPVEGASWLDAVRFCNKLSERHELSSYYEIKENVVTIKGGFGYRLPTEAEWEYACRAGASTTWHFGEKADDLKEHAWFAENSGDRTHPVGKKKANQWDLYDMLGNVPEWCWDRYDPKYYDYMPASDPPGSGEGRERTFRGEAWNSRLPRTTARPGLGFTYAAQGSINIIGFRVARNAE